MTADGPRLPFNVREGVKRLLIVAAIASVCSIGATTWAWLEAERADSEVFASAGRYDAAVLSKSSEAIEAAREEMVSVGNTWSDHFDRFISLRKWTVVSHLVAAAAGLVLWALSGFFARQKAALPNGSRHRENFGRRD